MVSFKSDKFLIQCCSLINEILWCFVIEKWYWENILKKKIIVFMKVVWGTGRTVWCVGLSFHLHYNCQTTSHQHNTTQLCPLSQTNLIFSQGLWCFQFHLFLLYYYIIKHIYHITIIILIIIRFYIKFLNSYFYFSFLRKWLEVKILDKYLCRSLISH